MKKTPAEGRVREIQRVSSEKDSSRRSSKEDSREVQVKKTPVDGRAKEIQRVSSEEDCSGDSSKEECRGSRDDSSRGPSKEDKTVLPSGKTPYYINPIFV
jgi:hypothetical protein